jgi:hypothetical protein
VKIPGDSNVTYSAFWFDPEEHAGEPVFIGEFDDGVVAMMTLSHVQDVAYTWAHDDAKPNWNRLQIKLPGQDSDGLLSCIMQLEPNLRAGDGNPQVVFLIDGGDEYRFEL